MPNAWPALQAEGRALLRRLLGDLPATGFTIVRREPLGIGCRGARYERLDLTRSNNGAPVRAFLAGPAGTWSRLPAVLVIHAHGNRYEIGARELIDGRPALIEPAYGEAFAGAGIVSLCIDLPCFGECADESESRVAKRHLWRGETLFGAMLAALTGALEVLEGIEGVDPARIGTFGISMGATLGFWLAALEPRIRALAHLCCFADLATLIDAGNHDLHGIYMMVPGLTAAIRTGEIAGLVAPRPQIACMGALDPLTPEEAIHRAVSDARVAYAAAGAPSAFETLISPETGHVETPAMRAAVLDFFRQNL